MLVVGTLAGLLYALIPALLKVRLGVSEILTSLMLVYVAELLLDYMARGPLRDPAGFNFPQSVTFDDAARLPYLMEGDTLHAGVPSRWRSSSLATLVLAPHPVRLRPCGWWARARARRASPASATRA